MISEIAYIDDNVLNLECIELVLKDDFSIKTFNSPLAFLSTFNISAYACIVVDIHMPEMDGFTLYEKIIEHPHYNGCPILFISSDDSEGAKIKSLALGAVDFLNREINPSEMVARIKAKILYFQKHRSIIEFSNLKVNLTLLKSYINNVELPLTFIEFKILCLVLQNYPDVLTRQQVVDYVWRTDHVLDATIYTHVSNLNSKLNLWDHEISGLKTKGVQLTRKVAT